MTSGLALEEALVVPLNDAYKLFREEEDITLISPLPIPTYRFSHDRVRQAAYGTIPEDIKSQIHYQIGKQLLDRWEEMSQSRELTLSEDKLFVIVNQLNLGMGCLHDLEEKTHLAQLNLIIARKAEAIANHREAFRYAKTGISLLDSDSWQTQYLLTLALYETAAKLADLNGDDKSTRCYADIAICQAKTPLDAVGTFEVKIAACQRHDRHSEVLEIARQILSQLGCDFPKHLKKAELKQYLAEIQKKLNDRGIETLPNLPPMGDRYCLARMRILSRIVSAMHNFPDCFAFIAARTVDLSLDSGNSSQSPLAYSLYASLLCSVLGNINTGNRLAKIALALAENDNTNEVKAKVTYTVNSAVFPWKQPLSATLEPLTKAYRLCVDTGDWEYANSAAFAYLTHAYFSGKDLESLEQEIGGYRDAIAATERQQAMEICRYFDRVVAGLRSENNCDPLAV